MRRQPRNLYLLIRPHLTASLPTRPLHMRTNLTATHRSIHPRSTRLNIHPSKCLLANPTRRVTGRASLMRRCRCNRLHPGPPARRLSSSSCSYYWLAEGWRRGSCSSVGGCPRSAVPLLPLPPSPLPWAAGHSIFFYLSLKEITRTLPRR